MHESLFALTVCPPRAVVLGVPLRPYAIGHELALWRQQNPLLTEDFNHFLALDRAEQIRWLVMAVDVCSQTDAEFKANEHLLQCRPARWHFPTQYRQWRLKRLWKRWENIVVDSNITEQAMNFRTYLSNGRIFPPTPTESALKYSTGETSPKRGRGFGAPLCASLLNYLAERPALLTDGVEPLDYPFAQAAWLYFSAAEAEGRAAIENDVEHAADAREKELLAEIEAERAAARAQNPAPTPE